MVMWRGGSCAAGRREPCQAGNRAALSGLHCAPQSACPPHDQVKGSLLFYQKGNAYVPRALQKMETSDF